jgi:fluoride exporter
VTTLLMIGLGGFLGSVARYLGSGAIQRLFRDESFPVGTLVVNLTGCLVIGFVSHLVEFQGILTPRSRAFLVIGLLGGFTTFSSFGNETVNLLRAGGSFPAALNVAVQVAGGILLVWAGRNVAYLIWR